MRLGRRILGGVLAAGAVAAAAARALRAVPPAPPAPRPGRPARYGWRHAEIFYTERGEGPPALAIHDLYTGASGDEWGDLAEELAGEWRVVVPDLPGFGRSGHPPMRFGPDLFFDAIVEMVRHAIDEPTLLLGSGLGAAYAVEAAVRLGDLVTGVALLAPPEPEGAETIEAPTLRPLAYQLLRSPFGELYHAVHAASVWRRHALERDLAAEPADLGARAEHLHRYARQPGAHWPLWSLWVGDLQWDPRPALARLGAPALVLWGAESRSNPAAPEAYRAVRPDLEQRVVAGTGRWPHVDRPVETADLLLDWWARVHPPGSGRGPAAGEE